MEKKGDISGTLIQKHIRAHHTDLLDLLVTDIYCGGGIIGFSILGQLQP